MRSSRFSNSSPSEPICLRLDAQLSNFRERPMFSRRKKFNRRVLVWEECRGTSSSVRSSFYLRFRLQLFPETSCPHPAFITAPEQSLLLWWENGSLWHFHLYGLILLSEARKNCNFLSIFQIFSYISQSRFPLSFWWKVNTSSVTPEVTSFLDLLLF